MSVRRQPIKITHLGNCAHKVKLSLTLVVVIGHVGHVCLGETVLGLARTVSGDDDGHLVLEGGLLIGLGILAILGMRWRFHVIYVFVLGLEVFVQRLEAFINFLDLCGCNDFKAFYLGHGRAHDLRRHNELTA